MRWFAIAVGSCYVIRLLRGAVVPKLLPPAEYGLPTSLLLPLNYLRYSDFGVLDQLSKRLPYLRSSEGEEAFHRHVNLGTGWTLGMALIGALGLVVASFWASGPNAAFYREGLRLVALLLLVQRFRLLLLICLNAREEFHVTQVGVIASDASGLAFTILGILWLGPIGMIWALVFSEVTVSVYLAMKGGLPRLSYAFRPMIAMIRESFSLLLIALIEMVMMTVDQVFLLRFFSLGEYGLYMVGNALASFILGSTTLFSVAQPRVMSLTGLGREEEAKDVISSTLSLYGLTVAGTLGLLAPAAAIALRFYLTKYQAGLGLYIVLLLVAVTRGPVMLLKPHFLALNQEKRFIQCNLLGLSTMIVLDGLAVAFGWGLAGIALGTIIGYGVASLLLIVPFEGSLARVLQHLKRYALYGASGLGVVGIYVFWAFRFRDTGQPLDILGLLFAAGLYEVAMLAVTFAVRADWRGALEVVRAQPQIEEKEISPVLSEVAE